MLFEMTMACMLNTGIKMSTLAKPAKPVEVVEEIKSPLDGKKVGWERRSIAVDGTITYL